MAGRTDRRTEEFVRPGERPHPSAPAGGEDRREMPRVKLPQVEAEVVSVGVPAVILEVGFGGLSITSEREFEVDETHELRCQAAGQRPVILRVQVIHCRPDDAACDPQRYVTGFQFTDTWWPGSHSALDEFIAQITKALGKP